MLSDSILTFARYANAVLAAYLFIAQAAALFQIWSRTAPDVRLRGLAIMLFAIAAGEGSVESIIREIPTGPRTFWTFVALAWACVAVSLPDKYRQFPTRK